MIDLSASDIAHALGGDLHGDRVSCPGPGHSVKDRSLSVWFDADRNIACHSFAGDDWAACMDHVRERLGLPAFDPNGGKEQPQPKFRDCRNERIEAASEAQKIAAVRRIWAEAGDPHGTLVEHYLRGRGLVLPDEVAGRTIRFHSACPWENGQRVPAMLCRYSPIENDLEPEAPPTAIHRTALKPDGSGHLEKKMLGPVRGQVVKLTPDEDVTEGLHLAEGVETAIACWQRGWRPIWAASSAGCIRTFPVLAGIEHLTIFADFDATGLDAAMTCAQRWRDAGRDAVVRRRNKPGADYADR